MRLLATLLPLALAPLLAQNSEEKQILAVVQKVFDGLAARNMDLIRSAMLSDARLYAVRDNAAPTSTSVDDFVGRIAALKGGLLERFTGHPQVLIRGRMAQVWGEYEFLRDGQFSHCGVDSVSLFKTESGWKIASIVYTAETTGCSEK